MSTNKPARGAQFTPGPLVVECKKFIATPKAVVIAELNDGLQGEYPESGHINANATLIAAAPAMYLALQNIVEGLTDEITRIIEGNEPDTAWLDYLANKAGQATAQAEGRHHE